MVEPATLQDVWFIIAFGMLPITLYVIVRVGLIKSWYILEPLPGLLSGTMVYGAPMFGLGFIAIALLAMLPVESGDIVGYGIFFICMSFGMAGFVLAAWQPRWLKPWWVQWLEYEYGYCLDILIKEARAMGRWNWEAQVSTRANFEQWVDSVVERHRQEIDERWEIVREYRLVDQLTDAFMQGKPTIEDYVVPNVPEHRRVQEEVRLEEKAVRLREYANSGYFRPTSDFPGLDQRLEPGDTVIWRKEESARGVFWGTKATVTGRTSKRIKIELSESGKIVTKYVKPEKLVLEQYAEKTK
ncbi:MAG: hypothetical protein GY832_00535 [Chloroflexi bacterium]|nr:hypothetical protein [Chloroflexota bacterium]